MQIRFSEDDISLAAEIIAAYDPAHHPLFQDARACMSRSDWDFIVEFLQKDLRDQVLTRIAARSYGRFLMTEGLATVGSVRKFWEEARYTNFGRCNGTSDQDRYFAMMPSPSLPREPGDRGLNIVEAARVAVYDEIERRLPFDEIEGREDGRIEA